MWFIALIVVAKFFCFGMCAYYLYKWLKGKAFNLSQPRVIEQNNYIQHNVYLTDEQVNWYFRGRDSKEIQNGPVVIDVESVE